MSDTEWVYTTEMPGGLYRTRHDAIGDLAIQLRESRFSNPYFAASIVSEKSVEAEPSTTDIDQSNNKKNE